VTVTGGTAAARVFTVAMRASGLAFGILQPSLRATENSLPPPAWACRQRRYPRACRSFRRASSCVQRPPGGSGVTRVITGETPRTMSSPWTLRWTWGSRGLGRGGLRCPGEGPGTRFPARLQRPRPGARLTGACDWRSIPQAAGLIRIAREPSGRFGGGGRSLRRRRGCGTSPPRSHYRSFPLEGSAPAGGGEALGGAPEALRDPLSLPSLCRAKPFHRDRNPALTALGHAGHGASPLSRPADRDKGDGLTAGGFRPACQGWRIPRGRWGTSAAGQAWTSSPVSAVQRMRVAAPLRAESRPPLHV
jgi:hypothetical protein